MALATRCPNCGTTFRVVSDQLKLRRGLVKCGHCATVFNGIEQLRYVATLGDSPNTVIRPVPPVPPAPVEPPAPVAPRAEASTAAAEAPAPPASPADAAPAGPSAVPLPTVIAAGPSPADESATAAESAEPVESPAIGQSSAATAAASAEPVARQASGEAEPSADEAPTEAAVVPVASASPATEPPASESESVAPPPESAAPGIAAEDAAVSGPAAETPDAATPALGSPAPSADTASPPDMKPAPAPASPSAPPAPDRVDPVFDASLSIENHPAARPLPEPSLDREWVAKAATAFAAARAMPVNETEQKELPPLTLIEVERRPGTPVPRSIAEDPDRVPSFMRQREEMSRAVRMVLVAAAPLLALAFAAQALWLFHDEVAAALPATRPVLQAACARLGCTVELPRRVAQLHIASADLRQTSEDGGHELHVGLRNDSPWNQAWPVLDVSLTDVQGKVVARRMLPAADYLPAQPDAERLARDGLAANAEQQLVVPLRIDATGVAGYTVDAFFP